MTRFTLLEQLKAFVEAAVKDVILPVKTQEGDRLPPPERAAEVHRMRLPDSTSYKKKAPYIILELIQGEDWQDNGRPPESNAVVRLVFCVYDDDEEEGALRLLTLMERVRTALMESVIVGGQFELDLQAKVETSVYTEDTAPYFAGEMLTTWKLPAIQRRGVKIWR